ncbi:MAG: hypothetical protein ACLQPH_02080 [Acidimicrobiales bacterium]
MEVDTRAVAAFVEAFDDGPRAAGVDPDTIHRTAPSALERAAPARDLVIARFAAQADQHCRRRELVQPG